MIKNTLERNPNILIITLNVLWLITQSKWKMKNEKDLMCVSASNTLRSNIPIDWKWKDGCRYTSNRLTIRNVISYIDIEHNRI